MFYSKYYTYTFINDKEKKHKLVLDNRIGINKNEVISPLLIAVTF